LGHGAIFKKLITCPTKFKPTFGHVLFWKVLENSGNSGLTYKFGSALAKRKQEDWQKGQSFAKK
jgi:hypothetical protein